MEMSLYDCKIGNLLICFECGESSIQCKCTETKVEESSFVSAFE